MSDSSLRKRARILRVKAARCLEEERFKEAEEALKQAVAHLDDVRQSDSDEDRAATLYWFGRCLWAQRMYKEAESPLKQALEFQKDRLDARADTLLILGSCALSQKRIETAERWLREGVDIQGVLYKETDLRLAFGLHELGVCLTYKGKCEEGKECLLRALFLHQQSDIPGRKLTTSHELGVCLTLLGQYHDAEVHFRQSLEAGSRRPGITRIALAGCLIEQFKVSQAEKELRQAISVVSDTDCWARSHAYVRMALCCQLARHHSTEVTHFIESGLEETRRVTSETDQARVLTIVGEVLTLQQHWGRAEKTLREALAIQKKCLPPSHPDYIRTLARLGECLLYQGYVSVAKGVLEIALGSCEFTMHNHPERGRVLLSMGRLHANFRNWGEAATSLTEAVKILGQSLGGHPITTEASCELSECMTALGVPTDATEVLIRALPALTDSPLSPSSRRSSFENSEVESLKHENATLKQRLEQELESHQEAVRALGSRCEVLAEQLSTLQAQQRDINMQEQQLFGMRRQVENLQDTSNYQATRILFQQKAIGNLSQRNEELLGRIAYLEERCSISDKRRLSIEHACQEGQKKLMQYDDILTIPAEDVEIKDLELGHGSFGVVRHGQWRGSDVAVKIFHEVLVSKRNAFLLHQEMTVCSLVHHPNIVPMCGVTLENDCPVSLVLEMQEASLGEVMNAAHRSGNYLNLREQVDLVVGCLAALTYLHELRPESILHGDIRPTNVLVTALMVAKLGDLGAAHLANESLSVGALSPHYVAPEREPGVLHRCFSHNTQAADIYSTGVTMAELFTGVQTGREGRNGQLTLIQHEDLFDLCGQMESLDPSKRPDAKVALERMQRLYSHSVYEQSPAKRMVRGLLYGNKVVLVNISC